MGFLIEVVGLMIAVAFALAALKRSGVDIGWLNPFTLMHRRRWRQKVTVPSLYALEHPVEVVAVMALAAVQTSGMVTRQQKTGVLALLQQHLSMNAEEADKLWILASHLLRNRALAASEVPAVLEKSAPKFTDYHQKTLLELVQKAIAIEPPENAAQRELVAAITAFFQKHQGKASTW